MGVLAFLTVRCMADLRALSRELFTRFTRTGAGAAGDGPASGDADGDAAGRARLWIFARFGAGVGGAPVADLLGLGACRTAMRWMGVRVGGTTAGLRWGVRTSTELCRRCCRSVASQIIDSLTRRCRGLSIGASSDTLLCGPGAGLSIHVVRLGWRPLMMVSAPETSAAPLADRGPCCTTPGISTRARRSGEGCGAVVEGFGSARRRRISWRHVIAAGPLLLHFSV